ncbi:cyclin N-terminal domain-containing protein 1-like isoform X1 [Haliotis rubra]|uniref:cyclin N-terminal domain-containing protein 1-like isoform X1 n=1 Tax=Haliotis rubra TaxID=36100 RepID=UPI001EE50D14|nr:cyclin N-terminal domain-containing protein 1-like isoform X1 [Haliotis rubra]
MACKPQNDLGIFGTPQEPFFNHKESGVTPELLGQWLLDLSAINSDRLKGSTKDCFKSFKHVDLIYKTCDRLKMSAQVKLLAVEIFNRFMTRHIEELYNHVLTSDSQTKRSDWDKILQRIIKQQALRITSCCQIASKLTSHHRIISVNRARRFLCELGHNYTAGSILQSELRILKTLEFKLAVLSPLQYVETLLEIIGHNDKTTDVKLYHSTAIKLLYLFNLKRTEIYDKLYKTACSAETTQLQNRVCEMVSDMLLLGTAVITASAFIMDMSTTDTILENLSLITKIVKDEIVDFATVIVEVVQENKSHTP